MSQEKADRLRAAMTKSFPEAMITGFEPLIAAMPNHHKDRHVAAAAVKVGAQVIVTCNLKDFEALPDGIEAQSPDEFLCNLFDLNPDRMLEIVPDQASVLRNPPQSLAQLLAGLATVVPEFASSLAACAGLPWLER